MNSLEKKLIVAISAVVLLMIAAGIIAFKALNDSIEINQQVSNTREILTEVESTMVTLKDAETDQRDYITGGKTGPLDHFYAVCEDARKKITRLKALTANNANHQARLARVEPAVTKKLDRIHQKIILRADEKASVATEAALSDEESKKMDEIDTMLGEMKAEENGALEQRVATSEEGVRNVTISFASLFILIVALLLLVFFLVKRDVVTQKQLHEKLRELATIDELTGLYTRRELNRCFSDELERFQRYEQPFSLLLLDVDHFKSVNDDHGHQAGDKVLQGVAHRIRSGVRTIDIAGRFGGEEFAVLLPNTNSRDAYVIAERIRCAIAAEPFNVAQPDGTTLKISVTISIGVSLIAEKDETEADMIRTADSALYQAKDEGRDRTVIFEQVAVLQ